MDSEVIRVSMESFAVPKVDKQYPSREALMKLHHFLKIPLGKVLLVTLGNEVK